MIRAIRYGDETKCLDIVPRGDLWRGGDSSRWCSRLMAGRGPRPSWRFNGDKQPCSSLVDWYEQFAGPRCQDFTVKVTLVPTNWTTRCQSRQDRRCAYDATLRGVRVTTVAVDRQ